MPKRFGNYDRRAGGGVLRLVASRRVYCFSRVPASCRIVDERYRNEYTAVGDQPHGRGQMLMIVTEKQ